MSSVIAPPSASATPTVRPQAVPVRTYPATAGTGGGGRLKRLPLLSPRAAFYLQASIAVSFLAASSAPTPLYAAYQAAWHFSPITTTVVFGVYALTVLAALLVAGSLSDHIGRRPILLATITLQAASMLVFTTAGSVSALMAARIVQGLATGAALGAVGAGMLDIDRAKGTITNAVAPMTGTATGALLSGALVQYLPAPEHLVYLVLFGVFVLQAVGVSRMRETSSREAGALASLRPQLGVPRAARGPLLRAVPVLVAVWALAGLYGSIGPAVVRLVTGRNSPVLGGLALFVLAASGALTVLVLRSARPHVVMLYGTAALLVGVGGTLLGVETRSALLFFLGAVVAGSGFGSAFQGVIRTVVPLAAPHERSGLLSTVFVVSYLGMGLPAVVGGYLVVHTGLLTASRTYGIAVMVLSATALLAVVRPRRRQAA
jgi:MFS family permease